MKDMAVKVIQKRKMHVQISRALFIHYQKAPKSLLIFVDNISNI